METITLFLTPEFDTIRDEMGYDENDDFDAYDILFQQGYDGEMIEVEENEIFEIPEGYIATIQATDTNDEFLYTRRGRRRFRERRFPNRNITRRTYIDMMPPRTFSGKSTTNQATSPFNYLR